jgi:shikimate kinase
VKVLVEGKRRAIIRRFVQTDGFFLVEVDELANTEDNPVELAALVREVQSTFEQYVKLNKRLAPEILVSVQTIEDAGQLADTIAGQLQLKITDKQALLETTSPLQRLSKLYELLKAEMEILQVERKIRTRVKRQMEKTQREYYLNEQMQAIQKELGDRDEFKNELGELEERANHKNLSKEAAAKVKKELKKLKMMAPMSAEAAVVRNYIDWVLALPWGINTEDKLDVSDAERILDEDHFGLKRIKERILEYLAVQALVKKQRGPILCLVGPPGVGKTSLARSIARATGRSFVRLALGGVRDEAEIRGHRRTYIGALPGKIIQSLKKAGSSNPVFLLDEVDKMSTDFRGRPVGGAARGAGSGAEPDLQRPLPGSRLRPLGRHVHHHGQLHAGHPRAAAGPHGDHPAAGLHRVREAGHRREVPLAQGEEGSRHRRGEPGHPRGDHPLDRPSLHQGGRRPQPRARAGHHLPQDRQGLRQQPVHHLVEGDPQAAGQVPGTAAVPGGALGRVRRDWPRQRPGRHHARRGPPGHRGLHRRRQGEDGADRQAGRRHAGVGPGRHQLRALAGALAGP